MSLLSSAHSVDRSPLVPSHSSDPSEEPDDLSPRYTVQRAPHLIVSIDDHRLRAHTSPSFRFNFSAKALLVKGESVEFRPINLSEFYPSVA